NFLYVPTLFPARAARGAPETHCGDLGHIAQSRHREPSFRQALAARVVTGGLTVLRQWGQGHRYRLAQLVAFEIHTGQHSHEATTLGHLSRNAEELRHRSRLI